MVLKHFSDENLIIKKHITQAKTFCEASCSEFLYIGVTQPQTVQKLKTKIGSNLYTSFQMKNLFQRACCLIGYEL